MPKLKNYQDYYDRIHSDKDYAEEADFLEKVIKKYSSISVKNILSLGCGTAGHEIILSKKSYNITGIDYSKRMLNIARKKAEGRNSDIKFKLGDIRKFNVSKKFDMAMIMYNVLCDIDGLEGLSKTFSNASRALKKNAIFIFDCWYGPAILKNKPVNKIKNINFPGGKIIQTRYSELDAKNSVINTKFEVFELRGAKKIKVAEKKHKAYFWYLPEIEYFLNKSGFKLIKSCNLMDIKSDISENNWDMFIIAKKI